MPFASFKYHISPSFPSHRIEELKHVLDRNGASEVENGEGWLKEVNLVVSNSMRFEGWEEVKERNEKRKLGEEAVEEVYVVTDKWVDRSLVLGKTQSPYHYSPDPSLIFSGVIACATSLPPSDLEVLSAGITALGGQWRTGLTKDVTHLFAISPDSQKYATAMHFREETGVKIILPHWFDDAVRLGMGGLSTDVYEWPDPDVLRNPLGVEGGQELNGAKKNMYAMAALFTAPMHESSSPALKDLQMAAGAGSRMEVDIWKGKRIVLSRTLQLFERRREAVEVGIKRAGGVVVRYDGDEEVDEGFGVIGGTGSEEPSKREKERRKNEADTVSDCDVLVTRWRDGAAYVVALRSHKTIGTLAWLFHVQSTGTLTRPLDQLLHYPVPKRPIEAFSNHVITVTNYTGEAREYLKKLIIAMGAKFTPSMSGQNTVLIAAYLSGTKATKAQSWSIPIVNHTWLEDCFIQWRNLTVGLEKYIGFPTGVDFSRLLGVRGVGGAVDVEGLDAEVDAWEGGEAPHGTDASVKEVQGLVASEDVNMVDGREEVPVPMMDVDGGDEDEETPTKKAPTFKPMVNGPDTSPLSVPTSSRVSPKKLVPEHDDLQADEDEDEDEEELKTNGKQKRKPKNSVSSEKSTRIQKQKKANKTLASSEDEIQAADDDESEMEMVLPKVKANLKGKEKQVQPRSGKTTRDGDDSEVEAVSSKIAKTDLNAKGKGKGKEKVSTRPKKSKDDEEDEDEDMEEEASKKKTHSKDKINVQPRPTKPKSKARGQDDDAMDEDEEEDDGEEETSKSNGVMEVGKKRKVVDDDNESDKAEVLESEDELSLPIPVTPPPRAKNTKLIRRVSQVVVPDTDVHVHSQEEWDEEQRKEKPRLSLIEKSQAKHRDARTRVRKRKVEVVEAEVDENEQEEPVISVKSSSSKRKTKAKTASTSASASIKVKGKERSRVHHSDSEEEEEAVHKPQPQKTTKKSVKESKPTVKSKSKSKSRHDSPSDDDDEAEEEVKAVQQPSDSNSDLPAPPVLSLKKAKRVSGGSISKSTLKRKPVVSISAPAAKSTKSKARARGTVESEDEDGDEDVRGAVVITPKRAITVLMPSFNHSANKKGGTSAGVKEVEKSRSGKKAKLSVSSEEDDKTQDEEEHVSPRSHAITRTESIRVMSNHHVRVSAKNPSGAVVSGSVKKNASAVVSSSSKSKPKLKPAQMDIDSPSPPSPPRATKTAMKSNIKSSPKTTKTPIPPLKRSAAAKATQRLHDTIMPDLVHFESQMKRANAKGRKSDGMSAFKIGEDGGSGGKRSQDGDGDEDGEERVKKRRRVDDDGDDVTESVSVNTKGKGKRKVREEEEEEEVGAKKRSLSKGKKKTVVIVASDKEEAEDEDEDDDDDVVVSSKGAKTKIKGKEKEVETSSKSGIVLLTTQITLSDEVIRTLTKLGVKMTSRPSECTHLLAPQLVRTEKFLCALVVAPFILTEKWATRSAAVKKLLPEKGFALHDSTGENKYGVDLMQSLRRAKELGGKLLAGQTFYVTPKVPVDTKLLKNVVNACGGQVTTQQPTIRIINASPENRHVISCQEDIAIWRPIAAQGIPIYSQELVLTGVLKQEMEWDGDEVRVDI